MSENMFFCKCGFKSVEGQLAKSEGKCPKCGVGKKHYTDKYGGN